MKKLSILTMTMLAITLSSTNATAANTTNVLAGGVCINEILVDPNGIYNFDTDGDGTAYDSDEFVELFNLSGSDIDISGWQLWDAGLNNWFTFPGTADDGTAVLSGGAYAVVVVGVQAGGDLPIMTNPDSLVFDAGIDGLINNGGDNIVLYDPGEDEYIQIFFNNDAVDLPEVDYAGDGFPVTAERVGDAEDFGNDTDGKSLMRYPAGDTNIFVHDAVPGITAYASPNHVTLNSMDTRRYSSILIANVLLLICVGLVLSNRRL